MRSTTLRSLSLGTLCSVATLAAAPLSAQEGSAQTGPWPVRSPAESGRTSLIEADLGRAESGAERRRSLDPHTGVRAAAPSVRAAAAGLLPETAALLEAWRPQDTDYSVPTMFDDTHARFLQAANGLQPNIVLQYGLMEETGVGDEVGQVRFDELQFDGNFRLPVDPDTFLVLGAGVGVRRYDFSNPNSARATVSDADLWRIGANVGVGRFFSDDLLIEAVFRPGLYSDLSGDPDSGDWQFFGDVIATQRLGDADDEHPVYMRYGVRVAETFEETPLYPLLGLSWSPVDEFRLDILLPEEIRLSWLPSAEWILSGGLELQGNVYQYRMDNQNGIGNARLDARVQELRLFVDGTYRFSDEMSAFGRVGSVLTGDYDWQGVGRGEPNDWTGALEPTLFFEVGLGWDF